MKYGLSEKQLQEIRDTLASHDAVEKAILFGSRAIDTYKEASDVDIAIKGEKADFSLAATLKDQLEEETYLPFFFDVVAYNSIESEELRRHIDGKGKVLYQKGMSEWKNTYLTEITSKIGDGLHGTPKYDDSGEYFFINGNNFINGKITIKPDTKKVGKEEYDKYLKPISDKTIFLSINGTIGNLAFYNNEKCVLGKSACYINVNEKSDRSFLYYVFNNKDFQYFITEIATGTTIPNVPLKGIREYTFLLPPLPEQKAIAEVLSSLDDKIDLLHRQNKTLEQMAETLFRQWFVEEAGGDWEEKPLSFFGDIVCGKTPPKKKKEFYNGDVPFIKIPDMHGKTFIFSTDDSLTAEGKNAQIKKTLPPKSICISCIATVGLVSLTTKESHTNQQINSIIPNEDKYRYYLFLQMKYSYDLLHSMASGGTATLNLNTGNFSKINIPLPKEKTLKEFQNKVEPLFDKIYKNQQQTHIVERLRDTLLPKLMSGEVRVNDDKEENQ